MKNCCSLLFFCVFVLCCCSVLLFHVVLCCCFVVVFCVVDFLYFVLFCVVCSCFTCCYSQLPVVIGLVSSRYNNKQLLNEVQHHISAFGTHLVLDNSRSISCKIWSTRTFHANLIHTLFSF